MQALVMRLTASALICSGVLAITERGGTVSKAVKALAGIFMTLSILASFSDASFLDVSQYYQDVEDLSQEAVAQGENIYRQEMETIIKDNICAYILDKAAIYGAELTVEVRVVGSDVPVPEEICITGSISPYGRKQLQEIIKRDLGIDLEDQVWMAGE